MAKRKISGKNILLMIDPASGTDYSLIVCLTSQSLARTTNAIDAASKCGPDKLPGEQEITVDFEGMIILGPDGDDISEGELHDLWEDSTEFSWKYGEALPTTGSVTYAGKGFLSDLNTDAGLNDPSTFSGTIQVKGSVTKTVTA